MNRNEKTLISNLLKLASEEFSNHGCNDVEEDFWQGWTKEERQSFVKEYHEWNGDPDEYDENFLNLPDYAIMKFLAYKLLKTN
jgi:hypothetical protein